MPFGDGSGPGGMGPQTGRGFGYCSGFSNPGFAVGRGVGRGMGRGPGRSLGRGAGFGRVAGFGPGYNYPANYDFPVPVQFSPEQEKSYLKDQITSMEKTVNELKKRMGEIDKQK